MWLATRPTPQRNALRAQRQVLLRRVLHPARAARGVSTLITRGRVAPRRAAQRLPASMPLCLRYRRLRRPRPPQHARLRAARVRPIPCECLGSGGGTAAHPTLGAATERVGRFVAQFPLLRLLEVHNSRGGCPPMTKAPTTRWRVAAVAAHRVWAVGSCMAVDTRVRAT